MRHGNESKKGNIFGPKNPTKRIAKKKQSQRITITIKISDLIFPNIFANLAPTHPCLLNVLTLQVFKKLCVSSYLTFNNSNAVLTTFFQYFHWWRLISPAFLIPHWNVDVYNECFLDKSYIRIWKRMLFRNSWKSQCACNHNIFIVLQ